MFRFLILVFSSLLFVLSPLFRLFLVFPSLLPIFFPWLRISFPSIIVKFLFPLILLRSFLKRSAFVVPLPVWLLIFVILGSPLVLISGFIKSIFLRLISLPILIIFIVSRSIIVSFNSLIPLLIRQRLLLESILSLFEIIPCKLVYRFELRLFIERKIFSCCLFPLNLWFPHFRTLFLFNIDSLPNIFLPGVFFIKFLSDLLTSVLFFIRRLLTPRLCIVSGFGFNSHLIVVFDLFSPFRKVI